MFSKNFKALSAAILFAGLGLLPLQGATFPYFNDFSTTGFENINAGTGNSWSLNNGSYRNLNTATNYPESTASIGLTGVTVDFIMETQFTLTSVGTANANNSTLGFGLFGNTSNFASTGGASFYLADFQFLSVSSTTVGTLRILSQGDSSGFTSTNGSAVDSSHGTNLAISLNTTYTLRLEGWYDEDGTLFMSIGLFDEFGLTQIGTSATATDTSPLTGTYFGYRDRVGTSGLTTTIDYDNFAVVPAIPEPAHWAAIGGLGALVLLALRRRPS